MKRSSSSTGSRHRLQRLEQLAANLTTWLCLSTFPKIDKLDPASTVIKHKPVDIAAHAKFLAKIRGIPPEDR